MKKMLAGLRQTILEMDFDQKIKVFLFSALMMIALVVLIATTVIATGTLTKKSRTLASQQIDTVSKNLEMNLSDYNDAMIMMMLDSSVQEYFRVDSDNAPLSTELTNSAHEAIYFIINSKSNISYVAILKNNLRHFITKGNSQSDYDLPQKIWDDYQKGIETERGSMKYTMAPSAYNEDIYSLNIYRPYYDFNKLNQSVGLLCISIDEPVLNQLYASEEQELDFSIRMTDKNGKVLSDPNGKRIGSTESFAEKMVGEKGSFEYKGEMVIYNEIDKWGMYLVGTIDLSELLYENYTTVLVILVLIVLATLISMIICSKMLYRLCKPFREIKTSMQEVSGGNLEIRMKETGTGNDFKEMAQNFNTMVVQLQKLMEQVKEEQHQIEQIQLNALQSQIRPHFLYNTLDCIHWQALIDGNQQISVLVKALANYYRLCLSQGQDIIPLSQEVIHVKNYLIIQNMRYGDIIDSDIEIDPSLEGIQIPKMTLQPLVENCIYHGIKVKQGVKGTVKIRAYQKGGDVIVTVADTGSGMSQKDIDEMNNSISIHDESFGYGVRNVHKRIEILFGKGYGLFYRTNETNGITVEIRLPFEHGSI